MAAGSLILTPSKISEASTWQPRRELKGEGGKEKGEGEGRRRRGRGGERGKGKGEKG